MYVDSSVLCTDSEIDMSSLSNMSKKMQSNNGKNWGSSYKTLGLLSVDFRVPKKMYLVCAALSQQVARMTTWTSALKAAIPIHCPCALS